MLSHCGRPITMISRTLRDNEINFATNERELLAIVWALKYLRNYLYGVKNLNIYTDHQPLTLAVSERNPNAKIKRWKAFIDEHNANIIYKPGKENFVADALSRQNINALEDSADSDVATIHSEEYFTHTIQTRDKRVNCFWNQIILEENTILQHRTYILFTTKTRHVIQFSDRNSLFQTLQEAVNAEVTNEILSELPILAFIQHKLVKEFPSTTCRLSKSMVIDIPDTTEQREIAIAKHNRAHRAAQILRDYFLLKMDRLTAEIAANCRVCAMSKHNRRPIRKKIGKTQIPSYAG